MLRARKWEALASGRVPDGDRYSTLRHPVSTISGRYILRTEEQADQAGGGGAQSTHTYTRRIIARVDLPHKDI